MTKPLIHIDDPGIVEKATIEAWRPVGSDGYFVEEYWARYAACNHVTCSADGCNNICKKGYSLCSSCTNKRDWEAYRKRELKDWDGKTIFYSEVLDEYFWDFESVDERLEDFDDPMKYEDLRLMLCEPVDFPSFDLGDFVYEAVCEEPEELSERLIKAAKELNEALSAEPHQTWMPSNYAMKLEGDRDE